uniref:Uncharacterized protein n=1 Tax=Moniliophthora roreri TaxID=221103 RepID=A0A0W0G1F2_MONRR
MKPDYNWTLTEKLPNTAQYVRLFML